MTTDHLPDLPTLLELCARATADREAGLAADKADADAENILMVVGAATVRFGPDAAVAFGPWQPVDAPEAETLQMFARLTDTVYLRYTAEVDGNLPWFHLVVNCDACLSTREARVSDLADLAAALNVAGVR